MKIIVNNIPVFAATDNVRGDLSRPVFLLVHGAGMDHRVWATQTKNLATAGWPVLALDLPGHGQSGGNPLPTIAEMGDFLAAFIAQSKTKNVIAVGHSMGALACLQLAAAHPDCVAGLVLCGVAATMPVHPSFQEAAHNDLSKAAQMIAEWGYGAEANKDMREKTITLINNSRPGVFATDLSACHAYEGATQAATRLRCPTLLLQGEEDRMISHKSVAALCSAIPNAQEIILPRCGHMMMEEAPERVTEALITFAAEFV